jgi:hypothetical protein
MTANPFVLRLHQSYGVPTRNPNPKFSKKNIFSANLFWGYSLSAPCFSSFHCFACYRTKIYLKDSTRHTEMDERQYSVHRYNTVIYVFLLLGLCILIVQLPWLRFFLAFSSVVRQMPGYNSPRRGTARNVPIYFCVALCFFLSYVLSFLCCSMYCLFFLSFCVLFVCKCVLYYCHRVTTQLQLTNISYHIAICSGRRQRVYRKVLNLTPIVDSPRLKQRV